MKFRKLRINGFKGFADPVELPIKDGLSGIVGPNGCGKSNLVEAIGWVMGENRPSAMRSGSMEDVIFSGSATRPAGPLAEVQLVIDNVKRTAPPEFSDDDELVISRRIERDIGSSFLTNGRDVRWRDLQLLFADCATGARSSALVNQGQTNDIINAKPSARKGILEEAAGVGGLHRRRHEAELKLSNTEQNLTQINFVLEQLGSQINALNRQAKQAKRYRKLSDQLRIAEAKLLYLKWRKSDLELAELEQVKLQQTLESARLQKTAIQASQKKSALDKRIQPLRKESAACDVAVQRIRADFELNQSQENSARQSLATIKQQIEEVTEGIKREQELLTDALGHINGLSSLEQTLRQENTAFEVKHKQLTRQLQQSITELANLEQKVDDANQEIAEIRTSFESAEGERIRASRLVQQCEQREILATKEIEEAKIRSAEIKKNVNNANSEILIAEKNILTAEVKLTKYESTRSNLLVQLADLRNLLSENESRLGALKSEHREITKLVQKDFPEPIRLLDHVKVKAGYEAAFGAALGDDIFAPASIANSATTGWRDVTPFTEPPTLPEGVEPLANYVQAPDFLQRRLSQIGLVKQDKIFTLVNQLDPGQRVVTKEGDLIRWDGFIISGQDSPQQAALRLRQLNRLEQLTVDIDIASKETAAIRVEHSSLADEFADIDQADKAARISRRQFDEKLAHAKSSLSSVEADAKIAEQSLISLKDAKQRITSDALSARKALKVAEEVIAQLNDPQGAQHVVDGLKSSVEKERNAMLELRAQKLGLERENEERSRKLNDIPGELLNWQNRQAKAQQRIADLSLRLQHHKDELPAIEARPNQLVERVKQLISEIDKAEEKQKLAAIKLHDAEIEAGRVASALVEAERTSARSLELKGRADANVSYAVEKRQVAVAQINEKLYTSPTELVEQLGLDIDKLPDPDLQEIEVNRLKRSRDAIGAVNLMAEQDAVIIQDEINLLEKEKADLEAAVNRLRRTISSLNKEGRERLFAAFEQVNENFKALFTELFGGGKARLELVEGDDPLETGLEILCHPPGKRFSTISLLSGGEQTLTAVALIFAFFMANPAPICVLDEVDAPLDDANVMKFCGLMESIVQRTGTRFLVITHNPITMSRMDRLFGVTMQEKGVSKLVSVDLGEAEKLAA